MMLFPFVDYWWLYAVFTALVLVLLALDLGFFHRTAHAPNFRDASGWMAVWIALALLFCFGLYQYAGWKHGDLAAKRTALEFLTGYVVEESLSLDNMFVFVLVFSYFRIPAEFHYRVLFFGILGALIFRAMFVVLGSTLLQFGWVVILFGVFLMVTGLKMMLGREQQIEPENSVAIRLLRKIAPVTSTCRLRGW